MGNITSNKWIQLGVAGIVALIIGVLIGNSVSTSGETATAQEADSSSAVVTERVTFSAGSSLDPQNVIELPVTPDSAVETGWKDPSLCVAGRGRYFMKAAEDEREQYVLMYNRMKENPRLIGIYKYSFTEMPPPWKKLKYLLGAGGVEVVDREHWGLFTYFWDPTIACKAQEGAVRDRPYLIH